MVSKMKSQEQNVKNFGDRLREAIRLAGVRAADVARDLGVTQTAVSGWTRSTREPKFEVLDFLYKKYGINPLYVITGEGPPVLPKDEKNFVATVLAQGKKNSRRGRRLPRNLPASRGSP